MSVLEEAMLGFAQVFGLEVKPKDTDTSPQSDPTDSSTDNAEPPKWTPS